jgi:hypothetical protein
MPDRTNPQRLNAYRRSNTRVPTRLLMAIALLAALAAVGCGADDTSDSAAFCEASEQLPAAEPIEGSLDDPAVVERAVSAAQRDIRRALRDAPDDLRSSLVAADRAATDIIELLQNDQTGGSLVVIARELDDLTGAITKAQLEVREWTLKHCEVGA